MKPTSLRITFAFLLLAPSSAALTACSGSRSGGNDAAPPVDAVPNDDAAGDDRGGTGDAGSLPTDAATVAMDAEIPPTDSGTGTTTRDPLAQPFSTQSIWNMPLGSGAVYVPANISANPANNVWAAFPGSDGEIISLRRGDPIIPVRHSTVGWGGGDRCVASDTSVLAMIPWPSDYRVPSGNGNNSASTLLDDGRTILQMQPFTFCTGSSYVTSLLTFAMVDLYGDGITGAHGGSGLSAVGGSLRVGELTRAGGAPHHVLKVNLFAQGELHDCRIDNNCHRWPAVTHDSYAQRDSDGYGISDPLPAPGAALRMGALLALPPTVDIGSIPFETEPARLLAWTFQNYGAYVVDDTYAPGFDFDTEDGPGGSFTAAFQREWGISFTARVNDRPGNAFARDVARLAPLLAVVDNNAADRVGGGGTPRQPLAPEIHAP